MLGPCNSCGIPAVYYKVVEDFDFFIIQRHLAFVKFLSESLHLLVSLFGKTPPMGHNYQHLVVNSFVMECALAVGLFLFCVKKKVKGLSWPSALLADCT